MSQHDYEIVNQAGAPFRGDLNSALAAIQSNNSGSSEPADTVAYMWWADTTTGLLKQRNAANNAWVAVALLSNFALPSVQRQLATAFTTTGTSTAYLLTPSPAIAANTSGTRFRVTFHTAPGATPTLAVSGLTALPLKYRNGDGTKSIITSVQAPSGWISDVETDGTDWIVLNTPTTNGLRSRQHFILNSNTTLSELYDGGDIVVTTPCQLTFTSSPNMTVAIENASGGVVDLVFPLGSSYRTYMNNGDRVILCGSGSTGWYRAYSISNLNGVYPDSTAGSWSESGTSVTATLVNTWQASPAIRVNRPGVVSVYYNAVRTDSSGGSYYAIWKNGAAVVAVGPDGLAFARYSHYDVSVSAGDYIAVAVLHQYGGATLSVSAQVCTSNPVSSCLYRTVGA